MARVRVDDKPRTRCVSMDMLRGGNKSQPRGDNSIDKYRHENDSLMLDGFDDEVINELQGIFLDLVYS